MPVPTPHPRIPVTCDEELTIALDQAAKAVDGTVPRARLVRDLALRGAEVVVREASDRAAALEKLATASTDPAATLFDRELLTRVAQDGWGHHPNSE